LTRRPAGTSDPDHAGRDHPASENLMMDHHMEFFAAGGDFMTEKPT